jgi:ribulose-5-phosphate 4-epimerase/fuculose-1-phosphate aldolase
MTTGRDAAPRRLSRQIIRRIFMSRLNDLVVLSHYAGERFDLVQAGGGNTSVQLDDGTFWVKASGCRLGEVSAESGFVRLRRQGVRDILTDGTVTGETSLVRQEAAAGALLRGQVLQGAGRPSIEAYMHSLFDLWTLHTHPLGVNIQACRKDWQDSLREICPGAMCVPFATPGIRLALAIASGIKEYTARHKVKPRVVFLQNHGLIVTGPTVKEVIRLNEEIVLSAWPDPPRPPRALPSFARELPDGLRSLSRLRYFRAECPEIKALRETEPRLFYQRPFSPDGATFCGMRAVVMEKLDDGAPVLGYVDEFGVFPKIVCVKDEIYILALDERKARDIQDVLLFQLMVMDAAGEACQPLPDEESAYLMHWEAEKYRQNL